MSVIDRRSLLAGVAASATALAVSPLQAASPPAGRQAPGYYRFRLGAYELTALYDGIWNRPLDEKFVRNAPLADVTQALADHFLPTDVLPLPFTALLVNTGERLVLIDTGSGGQMSPTAGSLTDNLAAAGVAVGQIDTILISHFHPDHINGLRSKDGALVFPNAEIKVPAPEWRYWMEDSSATTVPDFARGVFLNAGRVFRGIADRVSRFEPGDETAPGIVSVPAFGHTPGHCAYAVESGGRSMLVLADTTNHPWLFVRNPDWQPIFDMDGPLSAAFRRKMLDRAAADRSLIQGYHFPFPATGHIARRGAGYDFVPVQWQPVL
jgi:glyoxylase-like metal-dependent hydrolase (beta-lactamase superfamily II)